MAKIKTKELRNLSAAEIEQKTSELQKELLELRQKRIVGQLDKPHLFRSVKRQIARLNTIKREAQHA